MKQQDKFGKLVKSCGNTFSPYQTSFSRFYKTSNGNYIIQFLCSVDTLQYDSLFFLYTSSNELQTKPLEVNDLFIDKTGERVEKKHTLVYGFTEYSENTQELTVETRCDSVRSCSSLGIYKFEGNRFVVKKLLDGHKENNTLRYKQIYP